MEAFFIPSASGNLGAIYHKPEPGKPHARDLLFIHGFAHEHTIARPVLASLWRRLSSEGTGVLSLDLPGCGDSAGEFEDASWDSWRSAVQETHSWMFARSDRPVDLGGLRLGAPLVLEASRQLHTQSLLLMQPVVRGEDMMTQFLRMRVAFSGLRGEVTEKETTQKLRLRIAAGEKLEVGGYILSPGLAMAIDGIDLGTCPPQAGPAIHWIETGPSVAARDTVEGWSAHGVDVSLQQVDVRPYWVHTRALVPQYGLLADEVSRVFAGRPA